MAQVGIEPPTFILFVNSPHLMAESYKKYLYNQFREAYEFTGVPIIMHMKGKQKREKPPEDTVQEYTRKKTAPPSPAIVSEVYDDAEGDDFDDDFDDSDYKFSDEE